MSDQPITAGDVIHARERYERSIRMELDDSARRGLVRLMHRSIETFERAKRKGSSVPIEDLEDEQLARNFLSRLLK